MVRYGRSVPTMQRMQGTGGTLTALTGLERHTSQCVLCRSPGSLCFRKWHAFSSIGCRRSISVSLSSCFGPYLDTCGCVIEGCDAKCWAARRDRNNRKWARVRLVTPFEAAKSFSLFLHLFFFD